MGPCTQNMLLRGNLILQGNPANKGQVVAMYNDTGVTGVTMHLRMVNNTAVLGFANSNLVHVSNADGTTMTAEISNNLLSGGKPYLIENTGKGTVSGTNNWMPTGTTPGALTATVFGTSPFKNAGAKDYTLAMGSNAIGAAGQGVTGLPDREYFQDEVTARMYRLRASAKDIGAFESTTTGAGIGPYDVAPMPDGGITGNDGGGNPGDGGGNGGDSGPLGGDGGNGANPGPQGGCGCDTSAAAALGGWPAVLALGLALRRRRRR
jgi:MYXO-CTERM domain-containing protein